MTHRSSGGTSHVANQTVTKVYQYNSAGSSLWSAGRTGLVNDDLEFMAFFTDNDHLEPSTLRFLLYTHNQFTGDIQ